MLGIQKVFHKYVSNNFQLIIFYGWYMWGGFLMTVIRHVCVCFGHPFEIFLGYKYTTFPFGAFTYDACEVFALIVVLRSNIKLGWLIYFVIHPKEFISRRLFNTCSVGCDD